MKYNVIERYYDNGVINIRLEYAGNNIHKTILFNSCSYYDEWETTVDDYINYLKQFEDEKEIIIDCSQIRPSYNEIKKLITMFNTVMLKYGTNTNLFKCKEIRDDLKTDKVLLIND